MINKESAQIFADNRINISVSIDGPPEITNLESEMVAKKAVHDKRETDLNDREVKIAEKEKQLSQQGEKLGRETILLDNDKATHNAKVAKLKEVISTF